jgi:hypothetical protein
MLNTLGIIATGALMMFNPSDFENTSNDMMHATSTYIETTMDEDSNEVVSYAITVDATEEKLEEIKAAAEEAGMGFTYKVRGVSKKKLVIDMVIENGDEYKLDRVTVTAADGVKYIQWETDENGKALVFVDETSNSTLTQK